MKQFGFNIQENSTQRGILQIVGAIALVFLPTYTAEITMVVNTIATILGATGTHATFTLDKAN